MIDLEIFNSIFEGVELDDPTKQKVLLAIQESAMIAEEESKKAYARQLQEALKEFENVYNRRFISEQKGWEKGVDKLVEARLKARTDMVRRQLNEVYSFCLDEETQSMQEKLNAKVLEHLERINREAADYCREWVLDEGIDEYLNKICVRWINENKIPLRERALFEHTISLQDKLKAVLEEHFVEVPEGRRNIIEEFVKKDEQKDELIRRLKGNLSKYKDALIESKKHNVLGTLTEDMVFADKLKFEDLVEDVDYVNAKQYARELRAIKENNFGTSPLIEVGDDLNFDDKVVKSKQGATFIDEVADIVRRV